jgi:hypothetical protein
MSGRKQVVTSNVSRLIPRLLPALWSAS